MLVIAFLASGSAFSAEQSRASKVCDGDKFQTNDWVICLENALTASETEVSALTAKAFDAIAKGDLDEPEKLKTKQLLETAQNEWKKFRDAECEAHTRHTAGLGFGAMQFRLVCLVDETMQRAELLKTRYELE